MPKTRSQRDSSPGDARKPYSDQGGPEGRHAQTHDVEAEARSNAKGPEPPGEDFEADLHRPDPTDPGEIAPPHVEATADKGTVNDIGQRLLPHELSRLTLLAPGVSLDEGATYLDLDDLEGGPFTQHGKREVGPQDRIVAKKETDYELWNRLEAVAGATRR